MFKSSSTRRRGNWVDAPSRATSGTRYRRAQAAFPGAGHRPTKPELAREGIAVVARWAAELAPGRTVYAVGDSAYTNRATMEGRPANVEVMGACAWTPRSGRPRRRAGGARTGGPASGAIGLPTPQAMAAARTQRGTWHRLRVTLYGRTVTPLVFGGTALWYSALRDQPVRYVVVRDPAGRRADEAFFCTDPYAGAAFILTAYAKRWAPEVTFFDLKQSLGFEDPQNQTERAVRRTVPVVGLVYAAVVLWAAQQVRDGTAPVWPDRPWYRRKATPSFPDLLAALRQASLAQAFRPSLIPPLSAASCPARRRRKTRRHKWVG
jgi:hypothetical protein